MLWGCRSLLATGGGGTQPLATARLRLSGSASSDGQETKKEPFIWLVLWVSDKTPSGWVPVAPGEPHRVRSGLERQSSHISCL